jgi:predicted Co/Zn/Cd cation transporter (cation efflux family)
MASMDMNDPKSGPEDRILLIAAGGNLLIAFVGILFAAHSGSQAILLDGVFNLR